MGANAICQQSGPLSLAPAVNANPQSDSAEQEGGQHPFQLQVQSKLVLVRVVVRDKNGEPVRGLKKGDFRLSDEGKEQTILQFEEVPPELPSGASPAQPSGSVHAPPTGSEQRFIAFYFDEFNSSAADLILARDAADRYFASSLQPNDQIAIFTPERMLCDFTSDRKKIHDALMQLRASGRGPANEHLCPDLSDYQAYELLQTNDLDSDAWRVAIAEARTCSVSAARAPGSASNPDPATLQPLRMLAQRIVDQAQFLARTNLEQFEKVVKSLANAPGQRSVVLVSPGFLSHSEQYALDRIVNAALRDQVVINSLDPKGLALLMRESNASGNAAILADPRASQARYRLDASKEFAGADVLAEVAQGTGGEFFHRDNDLKSGFAALTEDPPHYILAFSPQKVKWDGKFHRLKLTFSTKEKGHTIQARRGYFAVQDQISTEQAVVAEKTPKLAVEPPKQAPKEPVPPQTEPTTNATVSQNPISTQAIGQDSVALSPDSGNEAASLTAPSDAAHSARSGEGVTMPRERSRDRRMPDPRQGLIRVDVRVTDKAGKTVGGLSEKDFRLLDNNEEQKVVTFQAFDTAMAHGTNQQEVVLVIDELNMVPKIPKSVGSDAEDAMQAARVREEVAFASAVREVKTYLRANGGALPEPTMVYRLTADGFFAIPHVSTDGNEIVSEIENPALQRQIWSSSEVSKDIANMAKGGVVSSNISHSLVALGSISIEERRRPGRKLLLWIGNGWQIENRRMMGIADFSIELLTRLREARISLWGASEWPLYDSGGNAVTGHPPYGKETAVGDYWPVQEIVFKEFLAGPKSDSTDMRYLSLPVIATRGAGGVLNVPHNLAGKLREHVKNEGTYYSLTFDPPRTKVIDEYHHLKIEVDNPRLTSNVFADYYDEPVFYDQSPGKRLVTVKQLLDTIASARGNSESSLADALGGMQLTERLSLAKLKSAKQQVHGKRAREALQVVADESAFLRPPADELPSAPPPEIATQRQIISQIVSYINTEIPSLPNLLATRTTVQYHERKLEPDATWKTASPDQSIHEGETAIAGIRFHDGKEQVEAKSVKHAPDKRGAERLETVGTFGPILATVMMAASSPDSEIRWSRWEQGTDGQLAVFHYRVPRATPSFTSAFCCMAYDFDQILFEEAAPFHGEITANPKTGAVMRLTIQADLAWRLPLERSDVMVEYEPITRGTRTFICPAWSVSISRQRRTMSINEWGEGFRVYGPFETLMNDVRFEKYRVFGSTYKILPDWTPIQEGR